MVLKAIHEDKSSPACAGEGVDRRTLLKGMAAVGGMLAAGPAFAQAADDKSMPPQVGDFLTRSAAGKPLTPDEIRSGAKAIKAYAASPAGVVRNGGPENQLLVVRFDDADLTDAAKATEAEGVFAFTAICTHAGCVISGWDDAKKNFACPCHGSNFDPKNNGAVVEGPAQRKLPQLGLKFADGKLVVTSGFDGRIGGDETM